MSEENCTQVKKLDDLEYRYMEITKDLKEIKDDIKTIMDVLVPKLNPKQGIVSRMDQIELDLRQLQIDLIERRQSLRVATVIWSIISSSLVTALIMFVIGLIMRTKGI